MRKTSNQNPTVLLIAGSSGTGKSTVAAEIGIHRGVPWLGVDDLRLAFQYSKVTLPEKTSDLYYFVDIEERSRLWESDPELLCRQLIAVGEVMAPAIEIVIENHIAQNEPIIIEGDGILPSLLQRPVLQAHRMNDKLYSVILIEPNEEILLENMIRRNRGIQQMTPAQLRTEARTKWLFGEYLQMEAQRLDIPVITSQPWNSLADRIVHEAR